jgi:hypothetical protein
MGLADRQLTLGRGPDGSTNAKLPLAAPLARLLDGDKRAIEPVVHTLALMVYGHSFKLRVKITRPDATAIAQACTGWILGGTCDKCGGHGKTRIPGSTTLSERDCHACKGTGRMVFERQFPVEQRELARWAVAEIERVSSWVFELAAKKLAPRLDL